MHVRLIADCMEQFLYLLRMNIDQEQLLTNGDQLWPLIWLSVTNILFREEIGLYINHRK